MTFFLRFRRMESSPWSILIGSDPAKAFWHRFRCPRFRCLRVRLDETAKHTRFIGSHWPPRASEGNCACEFQLEDPLPRATLLRVSVARDRTSPFPFIGLQPHRLRYFTKFMPRKKPMLLNNGDSSTPCQAPESRADHVNSVADSTTSRRVSLVGSLWGGIRQLEFPRLPQTSPSSSSSSLIHFHY
jgi:hypothetical protein